MVWFQSNWKKKKLNTYLDAATKQPYELTVNLKKKPFQIDQGFQSIISHYQIIGKK